MHIPNIKDSLKSNLFNKLAKKQETQAPQKAAQNNAMITTSDHIFETIGEHLPSRSTTDFGASNGVAIAATLMASELGHAARAVPAPVKAVARMSVKSGAAGAIVDAAIGGLNAAKYLSQGEIDVKQAGIHILSEGVCGFLTAGAGTAGSISAYMITGSLGPIVLASGMASSVAVRWGYRQVIGDTLPNEDDKKANLNKENDQTQDDQETKKSNRNNKSPFDNIGC